MAEIAPEGVAEKLPVLNGKGPIQTPILPDTDVIFFDRLFAEEHVDRIPRRQMQQKENDQRHPDQHGKRTH